MSEIGKGYKKAKAAGNITIEKDNRGILRFRKKQFNVDTGEEGMDVAGVYNLDDLETYKATFAAGFADVEELIKDLKAL